MRAGPHISNKDCLFSVWAPEKENVLLHIIYPEDLIITMEKDDDGYFNTIVRNIHSGCRYFYKPDEENDYPDPASNYQPEGVHGPSEVIDHSLFKWNDEKWKGIPLSESVFYELHTGTFTKEGTFEAIIPFLDELAETGINTIELMPVSQFPGGRNWGYDCVYPYSVQNTYGGPDGLKKLVDAAHQRGIAVFLDVVYNHLGPEGNYFGRFAPYFTNRYHIPWGDAINFDDAWSDGVREYFSSNSCHWFENYHLDGLRLDAIHMIYDSGAVHFWEMMHDKIKRLEQRHGRKFYLIAESDLNSPRVVRQTESGGYGFDSQWLDDYHHALYVLLHPEGRARYEDFGSLEQLAKAYKDGFVHSGQYVGFRKKRHGSTSAGIKGDRFVAFNQNHDQVGNRVNGERLSMLTGFSQLKMAAAALLLSPYIPLLFMGEEYGDETPFFYFVSHSDEELVNIVREGRKKEFAGYRWTVEPPDPQEESTFKRSGINWEKRYSGKHKILLEWNRELILLRKTRPALRNTDKDGVFVYVTGEKGFAFVRSDIHDRDHILCILNFSGDKMQFTLPSQSETWMKILDSTESRWNNGKAVIPAPEKPESGEEITLDAWSVLVYGNFKK